ncbi:cytochrome c family protein [Povalibacter sp.]|uniref:c-type cytochrome n=1 Tax=Povalibacter sp. TaxID=1962978 RepID=UPI002F420D4B
MRSRVLLSVAMLPVLFQVSQVRADSVGDAASGKRLFGQCMACHVVKADAPRMMGPNLYGVVGRKAAAVPDFAYSAAMKNSAVVWNEQELGEYLKKPAAFMPGTSMVFFGVPQDQARADIIAYLKEAVQ